MLNPKKDQDQVDYSELLKPPAGFILDRAIGTTYSLDVQALLAVPVAMFYSKPIEADFENNPNPLDIFDSISRASETVTIFCQKGKIKVPRKFNKLLRFTEDCVKVILPKSAFSSFHPKCWWLWFHNPKNGEKRVRFAVMSRNLTFDRSWDISFFFEGIVTNTTRSGNKPLIELLNYLEKAAAVKLGNNYKKELERTDFKTELPFKSWNFYPIGISDKHLNPLLDASYRPDTLLMMSPFVDDASLINIANKASRKAWLFSRKMELNKLKQTSFEYLNNAFCIPDIIVNGEWDANRAEEIPNVVPEPLDLHAKLFISRKGTTNTWLLGSANLTQPAFGRNIEFLIELNTTDNQFHPDSVYKELVSNAEERKLFEEYDFTNIVDHDSQDNIKQLIRKLEYEIIKCPFSGKIIPDDSAKYFTYEMEFDASKLKIENDFKIYIQLINSDWDSDHGKLIKPKELNTISFSELQTESQLSKYFIFSITYQGKCVKNFMLIAEIDLPVTRSGKILAEIITSKDKFLQYLRFLLQGNGLVEEFDNNSSNRKNGGNENHDSIWFKYNIPLYEELLRAAAQQPQKLRNIDGIITKMLSNEDTKAFISPELIQLWNVFKEVI